MSETSDPTCCVDVGFAEVDFPSFAEPRLVVTFADGLTILMSSRDQIDLVAELIASVRLRQRLEEKGTQK